MSAIDTVKRMKAFYKQLSVKSKVVVAGCVLAVAVLAVTLLGGTTTPTEEVVTKPPLVTVGTVASTLGADGATFVGTVRSVSEADIQSERGGRVTTVRVKAGDVVRAGAIIATIENASEQAAVLQAQGAYEATLAAARQSSVGIDEAKTARDATLNNTVTTISSSYSTVAGLVRTDIDPFFASPESSFPALRIDGYGATEQIRDERIAVSNSLRQWQTEASTITANSNLTEAVMVARKNIDTVITLVDSLLVALNRDTATESVAVTTRTARIAQLTGVRTNLLALKTTLQGSLTNLANAEDAVTRAQIAGGSNGGPTASSAQIKQALGSLRSAQANLEKTILRSPITGTVEVLQVKTGDFLSPQTSIARVAGGQGLEISIFVGENDADKFVLGDTVTINNNATGTVVNIAPAFDAVTKKREVKVATTDASLVGGTSVSVSLATTATSSRPMTLQVPITAVKFTDTAGEVFVVVDNKLESRQVTLGPINGSFVTILSGIDATTEFVLDARGKTAGEVVEVSTK
ncbi:MAG: hypothetical protein RLZZ70_516 [Candidatus Parcubacteria bacterium]|jgi:RND family efflux transporter MFP subunit